MIKTPPNLPLLRGGVIQKTMIKLSNFPFKTLKTRPKISDNIST
jgi:hypothetical protein